MRAITIVICIDRLLQRDTRISTRPNMCALPVANKPWGACRTLERSPRDGWAAFLQGAGRLTAPAQSHISDALHISAACIPGAQSARSSAPAGFYSLEVLSFDVPAVDCW